MFTWCILHAIDAATLENLEATRFFSSNLRFYQILFLFEARELQAVRYNHSLV